MSIDEVEIRYCVKEYFLRMVVQGASCVCELVS
jgi:hypothetical protein